MHFLPVPFALLSLETARAELCSATGEVAQDKTWTNAYVSVHQPANCRSHHPELTFRRVLLNERSSLFEPREERIIGVRCEFEARNVLRGRLRLICYLPRHDGGAEVRRSGAATCAKVN